MTERRVTLTGLGLGLFVLIGLAAYAFERGSEQATQREAFREIRDIVEQTQSFQALISEAERGLRGFLLTHDPQYLSPYHVAVEKLPAALTRLEGTTQTDPAQQEQVQALRVLTERKLAELRTTLDMAQEDPVKAINFVRSDAGKLLMDDLQLKLTAILDRKYEILRVVDQRERQASRDMFRTIVGGTLLALGLIGIGTYRVVRDSEAREQADRLSAQTHLLNLAPIMTRDMDGRILSWSKGYERLYGWTDQEAVGKISHALLQTHFSKPLDEIHAELVRDGEWSGELTHRRHDGTAVPVTAHWTLLKEKRRRPTAVVEVNTDISDRQRAEQALAEQTSFTRSIVNSLQAHLAVVDQQGVILQVNDAWQRFANENMGGCLPRLFESGVNYLDVVRKAAASDVMACRILEGIEAVLAGRSSTFEQEYPCHSPSEQRWFYMTVSPLKTADGGAVISHVDITSRMIAEQALRASEERFRTLTTAIPQLVWTCRPDGRCDYLSEQWFAYTGTTVEQNLGYGWLSLIHPEDSPNVDQIWKEAVASGHVYMTDYRLRSADGSYRWHLARATPQRDEQGRIVRWFGTTTDISAQKDNEVTLQRINGLLESKTEALAAANKELEAFSYSVSHDLRAPLRTMTGFAQALLEDYGEKLEPEAARYLGIISNGASQMGRLIDDLLSFSRLSRQNLSVSTVSIAEVVREIRDESAADQAERTIEWDVADDLPPCRGDRTTIKLVLANLLGNALKYTRPREVATIQIGWEADDQQPTHCRIFVRDNGVGFDMRYADKLFTVFQRLHRPEDFEGTGVGLAIVQRIVHRHGGRVWADARPNVGATFWLTLELAT